MKHLRITVTLPSNEVEAIDRVEKNRSRFVADAVRRELARRHREGLLVSLRNPYKGTRALAEAGLQDWARRLPQDRASDLLNLEEGIPVKWVKGKGWVRRPK